MRLEPRDPRVAADARDALVAKRASVASVGSASAAASLANIASLLQATTIQPSPHRNAWFGTVTVADAAAAMSGVRPAASSANAPVAK